MTSSRSKTFLGALLVGGTALGAGMLALPVVTGTSGLIPAWILYLICWIFNIATGLLFIEVALWLPRNANIVSMATRILGPFGRLFAWALYLFLFYSLSIAYIAGGSKLIADLSGVAFLPWARTILFTVFFGGFVYAGTKASGRFNALLMVGLIVSYVAFVVVGLPKMHLSSWNVWNWQGAVFALPVVFVSFCYQGVIPTLLEYLDRDPKKTRLAVIFGTSLPFIAYLLWDYIIKGIVPVAGPNGLIATRAEGLPAIAPLQYFVGNPYIPVIGNFFAFFALTTSFIGVTLGLMDFLADSLNVTKTKVSKLWLCALVYVPPLVITLINPNLFLIALGYAGGFGAALLLGLLPALLVWVGRYRKGYSNLHTQLPGGRIVLALLILFVLFEVAIQIISQV